MKNIIFLQSYAAPQFDHFCTAMREKGLFVTIWYCVSGSGTEGNYSIMQKLFRIPKSIIIIQGWHCLTQLMVLLLAKSLGHVVCIGTDRVERMGKRRSGFTLPGNGLLLRYMLFPKIDFFLYASPQSRIFYKKHGVTARKLVSFPYHTLLERLEKVKKRPRKDADYRIYTSTFS